MTVTQTETVTRLVASTLKKYKKGFVDNIIADNILLAALGSPDLAPVVYKSRKVPQKGELGPGIKLEDGGRKIHFSLAKAKNSTFAAYSGHDTLDISPQDLFTVAEYDWSSYNVSVNLPGDEVDFNMGSQEKIFDLMRGEIDMARASYQDLLTDKLLGIKASGSKDTIGLMDIIKDDPTTNPTSGNLGGIDASTSDNAFWRNQIVNHAGAAFGSDQTGDGMKNLRKLIRNCTFGSQKPTLLLCGDSAFDSVENAMINQTRYVMDTTSNPMAQAMAKLGFDALVVKGIPLVREQKIETIRTANSLDGDAIYAINLNYLKLYGLKRRWFEPTEAKHPVDQDISVVNIITRLQFATNARRYHGVMYNVAAV